MIKPTSRPMQGSEARHRPICQFYAVLIKLKIIKMPCIIQLVQVFCRWLFKCCRNSAWSFLCRSISDTLLANGDVLVFCWIIGNKIWFGIIAGCRTVGQCLFSAYAISFKMFKRILFLLSDFIQAFSG